MNAVFSAQFLTSDLYNWVILPLLIFIGGMAYVTLSTLRNVFIARGFRKIVPVLGFFEVLIWLTAVSSTIRNLHNVACYLGFAGGYSMGIYIGLAIEARLALGLQVLRIITNQDPSELLKALQQANMGTTSLDGHGSKGPVKVIFTTVKRKDVHLVNEIIQKHTPNAFYTIEDIRQASQGVFPSQQGANRFSFLKLLLPGSQFR
jgi:uncharacterized protein YebE (UPF0316 family)